MGGLASQLFTTRLLHAGLVDQPFDDYKAMVCIFLYGGNDNGNTLIPYAGGDQNYALYAANRGNLAIPMQDLAGTLITPSNQAGRSFALHPALTDVKDLFDSGNAAILSGVGTLVEPTTKKSIQEGGVELPPQLFAHDWQQTQWQVSTADALDGVGWGGRIADALQASGANPNSNVSMGISIAGNNVFLAGRDVTPYAVGPSGPRTLATWGLGQGTEQVMTRKAYADLLALNNNPAYAGRHRMQKAYADITQRAIVSSEIVDDLLDKPTAITAQVPQGNWLASQLRMVARLIEYGSSHLNQQRQIFFVAMGGYDNHDGLVADMKGPGPHASNLGELNAAIKFFWDALGQIDMREKVTTHTASDFGRTYVSNGNGSDHGWCADHFVFGGSQVDGGKLYGSVPDYTIDGPQDTGNGRFIPTTSVDAYAFEMAKWMGVPTSEMSTVFPNLYRFLDAADPATHLGILS